MIRKIFAFAACCLVSASTLAMEPAETWLERSIEYHDPAGVWGSRTLELALIETRPDGEDRKTWLWVGPGGETFRWRSDREGRRLEGEMKASDCLLYLDGSADFSDEDRETYRLTCDRLRLLRDYYSYLWGLPMKLRDPGTRLEPKVEQIQLEGREVISLKVTYDPEVGKDIWYFYLDPETAALVAYRFYHDEAKGDGELIELEGEVEDLGMRLPKTRTWTTNAEGRLLGSDILVEIGSEEEAR